MQLLIAAGLLGALVGTKGPVATDVFTRCDGYQAPGKSDGFLTGSLLFGLAVQGEEHRPVAIAVGEEAVTACDQALADVRLKPEFSYRRSNLMLSKAVHLLAANKPADAIAVLDAEQALAGTALDRLRELGFGVASRMMRAKALIDLGRPKDAIPLIEQVEALRPYAAVDRLLASQLRMQADPSVETYLAGVRRNAPLMPGGMMQAMLVALGAGRMADVVSLGRGLTVSMPEMRGSWKVEGDGPSDNADIAMRAQIAGMLAYGLLASGNAKDADATLDGAEAAVSKATEPPPPPEPGRSWKRAVQEDYNQRLAEGGKAERALKGWRAAMTLRKEAPAMTSDQLFAEIERLKSPEISLMLADIVAQIGKLEPGEAAQRQTFIDKQHKDLLAYLSKQANLTFAEWLGALPRPETPGNQPKIHKAGDGYFLSDNGYSSTQMDLPDRWTVRFTGSLATPASIDEQAIASAAALTRSKGYGHFIIELRRQMQRTLHQIGMYAAGDINDGREAQLTIRMVRPDQLPADLQGAEWRIVDAAKVLADFDLEHPQTAQ